MRHGWGPRAVPLVLSNREMSEDSSQKCRNKAKIEASIAEAYILEEVSNFTEKYYTDNLPSVDDSLVVPSVSQVLGDDGGEVVHGGVPQDAQGCPGPSFTDARSSTPSRQPQPHRIQTSMGTRIHLSIVTLSSA